jgi:hypothetical protein
MNQYFNGILHQVINIQIIEGRFNPFTVNNSIQLSIL